MISKPMNRTTSKSQTNSSRWPWIAAIALIVGVSAWLMLSGTEVPLSSQGYEISKSLYAACNLEDAARLSMIKEHPDWAQLSDQERNAIAAIVELADQGKWDAAAADAAAIAKKLQRGNYQSSGWNFTALFRRCWETPSCLA
jgi:2-oxo-4-hydroxy-4-carboxy--5-ureidoimidazoline (OHCU) decarboxylase